MRRGRPRKDGGGDQTDQHIIMQLRKSISLNEHNIQFRNGETKIVDGFIAKKVCDLYDVLNQYDKFEMQEQLSESKVSFETVSSNL